MNLIFCIFFCLHNWSLSHAAFRVDPDKLYEMAKQSCDKGDFDKGYKLLEDAIKAGLSGDKLRHANIYIRFLLISEKQIKLKERLKMLSEKENLKKLLKKTNKL